MNYVKSFVTPYMSKYWKLMSVTVLLGVCASLSAALLIFASGYLISAASERPETILLVYVPIVLVRAFGLSRAAFSYAERMTGHNAVLKVLSEMRVRLYRALEPQALFIRSRFKRGDLLGTLADDIEHLQDVYIRTLFPTISGLFIFVFATVSVSVFDWKFGLFIGLCLSVIAFAYPMLSLVMMKKHQQRSKQQHTKLYHTLGDAVYGIRDWLISSRTLDFLSKFREERNASYETDKELAKRDQNRTFQLHLISGVITVIVGVWAGMQAIDGTILPTYIAAFTLVTLPIIESLIPISHAVERIPAYQEAFTRIQHTEDTARSVFKSSETVDDVPAAADIQVQGVSYGYESEKRQALKQATLEIRQGEKVAILGKSGAGKSTFVQLLLGALQPDEGTIRIAGRSPEQYGENIHQIVSVLNQKPYLFGTTIENNIRLGNPSATMEEVEQAIRQVGLEDYLGKLPDGLQTQTEEAGRRFSGGERQRIALARILLNHTPIVIVDEPAVGLDPETERDLIQTMMESLEGKTVIWITHHLMGMELMDHIVFLEAGEISDAGTHEELLENSTRYRRLVELDRGI
ncbi:thiol reductant ABC exporter subunit CydC [Sporosarcina gallistercoris]|uniref:Thiol reductant ABC exporter subunit CydC n=1 Tax=Sporosarcina gallistercoris TaxID=2762245 RepID=A0ABR8PIJ0_9BACL|nr:thiol reductant ABC exporter subunit CydC [Sporosarcina gallistercoris]MBD7907975.1 thiol reductant ABC exporter subunit CydC [Sporosarcina gallistercoris]